MSALIIADIEVDKQEGNLMLLVNEIQISSWKHYYTQNNPHLTQSVYVNIFNVSPTISSGHAYGWYEEYYEKKLSEKLEDQKSNTPLFVWICDKQASFHIKEAN